MLELVIALLALLLTVALLSYLVADNPAYRLFVHLFIGLSAGYAVVLAWYAVIQPQLVAPVRAALAPGGDLPAALLDSVGPLLATALGVLLLFKTARLFNRSGGVVVALMVGVGAAVAIGGALTGTLIPQTSASFVSLLPPTASGIQAVELAGEGLLLVVGTVTTLGFFYYGGRAEPGSPVQRPAWVRPIAAIGELFIGAAFGVLYAGAIAASIAIFAERASAIAGYLQPLLGGS